MSETSTWAPARRLEPIDQDLGKAIYASTQNPVLKQAWKDASEHSKDGLEYCKLRIRQQDLGRAESKVSSIESKAAPKFKVPEKRKRKGTPTFKYPPGYAREDVDDEESEDLFLKPGEPKIKTENSKSMSSAEMDALCDEPDPPFGLSEGQQSKRSKTDTTGRFSTRPTTPLKDCVFGMRDPSIATARNSRAASKMPASKKAIE